MKRLVSLFLCVVVCLSASLPAFCEEPTEEELNMKTEDDSSTGGLTFLPDEVYAVSDVDEKETDTPIEEGERPDFVEWLLNTARGELGYEEGPGNYSKYGEWMGDVHAAWCAEFVCWCIHQVDEAHGTELLNSVYPKYSGQNTGRDWFIKRGRFCFRKGNCPDWGYQWQRGADHYLVKNEFIPRSGDLVFFSYNEAGDTEHVALVEYSARNAAGEVVIHVIEGNNPSKVQRNVYKLDNSQVLGFGLCEDVVDTSMRLGNKGDKVLVLQERLNALGLLADKHLTGGFGSNTKKAVMEFQSRSMPGKTANGFADRETQQAIEAAYDDMVYNSPDYWLVED